MGRLSAKVRDHPVKSILMVGIGLWLSNLFVGEMAASKAARVLAPPAIAATLVGGTASALLVYLVVPAAFARKASDFWGTGAFGQLVVELALALVAVLAWSFLVLFAFGTQSAR